MIKKKIHLIGICGKGMSALAFMLKQKGHKVTGSDEGFYDPVASMLRKNKISFNTSHKKENIPEDADIIVIGRHAKLVPESNEEVAYAFKSGKKIESLPEELGMLANDTENTVIAGSFGKSSVTALLAWCLIKGGKDPSYFIGAVPLEFKNNAYIGKSNHFIFEGDEYPSSNWDNTSKFLYFHPQNAIIISGEHDHVNVFKTEKDYLKPYKKLVAQIPKEGLIVASIEGKNIQEIIRNAKCNIVSYSFNKKNTWHAENVNFGMKTSFELWNKKQKVTRLHTNLLGKYNIENIVGVSAFLLEKKLLSVKQLKIAVKNFKGISGRLDLKTKKSSVLVYEGFGSSYTKAKSCFEAIDLHFPDKKLITIFEPHTFSWRNGNAKKWYKDIFDTSEHVVILPPPSHGSSTHHQMSHQEITNEVKKNKRNVYMANTEKEALEILEKIVTKENIVLLMSSGSLFGLVKSVPKLMEKMFPKT